MIEPLIGTGTFDSDDIERLFDETERVRDPFRIGADRAQIAFGDMEAADAAFQVMERFEALGEALQPFLVLFEEIEHDTLGHLRSDGGER